MFDLGDGRISGSRFMVPSVRGGNIRLSLFLNGTIPFGVIIMRQDTVDLIIANK